MWLGPDNLGQEGLNLPHLRQHPQKKQNPKLKIFLSLQTRRLAKSFEDSNSSLAQWFQNFFICGKLQSYLSGQGIPAELPSKHKQFFHPSCCYSGFVI